MNLANPRKKTTSSIMARLFGHAKNSIRPLSGDRGESTILTLIGGFLAVLILVPAVSALAYFMNASSISAVNAERAKDLRSWAVTEFETKPWDQVMEIYESNENKRSHKPDAKFNFTAAYVVDSLDNTGGFVIRVVAPRLNVADALCNNPRDYDKKNCVAYEYAKTPTLSESIVPSWNGMNYGVADLQPANGTDSPSLAITHNRVVNVGNFDGCAVTTPDRLRVSFKWAGTNTTRPSSVQHLVIGEELFETVNLTSTTSGNTVWFAATINKPQPSLCYGSELVRIVIDNGARGTISDLYVSQLLSANDDLHDPTEDAPDDALPHIVVDPSFSTDGVAWYLNFKSPLTGSEVASYQVRGAGEGEQCATTIQGVEAVPTGSKENNSLYIGSFTSLTDLKTKSCDRFYITSVGVNGHKSAEISFITNGINKVTEL